MASTKEDAAPASLQMVRVVGDLHTPELTSSDDSSPATPTASVNPIDGRPWGEAELKQQKQAQQLLETVSALDLHCLLNAVGGPNSKRARKTVDDYKHFLVLKVMDKDWDATKLSPTPSIDRVWHAHVLHTRLYREACAAMAPGRFIEHNPEGAAAASADARAKRRNRTLVMYVLSFGVECPWEEEMRPRSRRLRPIRNNTAGALEIMAENGSQQ